MRNIPVNLKKCKQNSPRGSFQWSELTFLVCSRRIKNNSRSPEKIALKIKRSVQRSLVWTVILFFPIMEKVPGI